MRKPELLLALLLALTAVPARGQHRPDEEVQREAMKKLAFLVGEWRGEATVAMGPGEPRKLEQTEQVQWKLDGLLLLVEGTGRNPATGAVEFSALATISYDDAARAYRLRAHRAGRYLETELRVRNRGFEWGYTAGPATITNSMTLDAAGRWVETTDAVVNGGPPRRSLELRLARLPAR